VVGNGRTGCWHCLLSLVFPLPFQTDVTNSVAYPVLFAQPHASSLIRLHAFRVLEKLYAYVFRRLRDLADADSVGSSPAGSASPPVRVEPYDIHTLKMLLQKITNLVKKSDDAGAVALGLRMVNVAVLSAGSGLIASHPVCNTMLVLLKTDIATQLLVLITRCVAQGWGCFSVLFCNGGHCCSPAVQPRLKMCAMHCHSVQLCGVRVGSPWHRRSSLFCTRCVPSIWTVRCHTFWGACASKPTTLWRVSLLVPAASTPLPVKSQLLCSLLSFSSGVGPCVRGQQSFLHHAFLVYDCNPATTSVVEMLCQTALNVVGTVCKASNKPGTTTLLPTYEFQHAVAFVRGLTGVSTPGAASPSDLYNTKWLYDSAAGEFNVKPKLGIAVLARSGEFGAAVTPSRIAHFLRFARQLDKTLVQIYRRTTMFMPRCSGPLL
jgi:hypothetical protein